MQLIQLRSRYHSVHNKVRKTIVYMYIYIYICTAKSDMHWVTDIILKFTCCTNLYIFENVYFFHSSFLFHIILVKIDVSCSTNTAYHSTFVINWWFCCCIGFNLHNTRSSSAWTWWCSELEVINYLFYINNLWSDFADGSHWLSLL